jgi:hypothetical protein
MTHCDLTGGVVRHRMEIMGENEQEQEENKTPDRWVKVNPDEPVYQRLHLCKYLAELPELSSEQVPDTPTD